MLDLAGKRLVLGLTGGIACYKSAELVRRLTEQNASVDVVMTEAATRFITPLTLQALAGRPVFVDAWDNRIANNMAHIDLTRGADAVLVAPASADFIAKLAHGLADDLLSTLCLARTCPLLVAPAMNQAMWAHPATQRNIIQLQADGVRILGPAAGAQACGETGDGRMLEAHELVHELLAFFQPKLLAGRHLVITAGPTSEPIDPVRVLTNRSSGKTGYAIAQAAQEAGARVTLVSGPTALAVPRGVKAVMVKTALQMRDAVLANVSDADVFIAVAAVADWRVKNVSVQKLKRTAEGGAIPPLEFEPNPDILAEVAQLPDGPWCVGFAAETEKLHDYAQAKRQRKRIPLLVGNLAHKVMEADTTELVLFDERGVHPLPPAPKLAAARCLIAEIAARLP
jgi:phosphopantothenoylcysteine decarboxylase / phosphopantothenate---cysteine ligase